MMDDEGQDPFYSSYNEYSNNSSQPALMTDEEYRQYIVDGMYRRKNADKIAEEERQKAAKRKEQKEREKRRREEERRESERIRLENIVRQSEKLKKIEATHIEYDNKWKRLEEDMSKILHKKDIPWPIVGKEFSLESLKSFVIDSRLTSEENKKNVRKEQTRYHPDKFITRYMKRFEGSEKEKDTVLKRINEISSWLNEIWSQISNKN
ncbi:uncharacterized protein BX663DRAFT_243964 [Cokeromyces recurvatus]|uniref:uncharacterized protein n=1 Tax=Cokeromyces recurvatus TaxID=90255 RepID=UPI002220B737|nr:uncharacterized protein BX663DRAFT_243964 [Cokeromyces recurvatus]KAI7905876.1 hypothetical protein BX663DRAFT_243964 [Cokeromyces recurvatus]